MIKLLDRLGYKSKSAEVFRMKSELAAVRELSHQLSVTVSLSEMAELAALKIQRALKADALCIHLLNEKGILEMRAGPGCTDEFLKKWKLVPRELVPGLASGRPHDVYFLGGPEEFKKNIPLSKELVDKSNRHTIAYVPLIVNSEVKGMLGFSYNQALTEMPDKDYLLAIAGICAGALEHARQYDLEHRASTECESANRAKSEFVANVSHEIRGPLGIIQGFADLIFEASDLTAEQRQWVSSIRRNSRQLSRIVGEVLDLAKIESKKIELEIAEFSLRELLREIEDTIELQARQKGITIDFRKGSLPETIISDPGRLRQILFNLVNNAIRFTSQGRVEVRAQMVNTGEFLEITVTDTGSGIPFSEQKRIFEPFAQAECEKNQVHGGTGLGLPIAKILAETLGGRLILGCSEPGKGSSFVCTIKNLPTESLSKKVNLETDPAQDLRGFSVLLVEDNEDNQDLLSEILSRSGAHVDIAPNGAVGVAMALEHNYDVVLMDIQMPGLDGIQAVSVLRSKGYAKPIAALTAHALKTEKDTCREKGFDEYLTKPIAKPKLIETIRKLSLH